MELKCISTAGLAILVLTGGFSLHAADNAAQAAARVALEKEMHELDATPAPIAATVQPEKVAQPVAPTPITPTSAAQVMNVPPPTLTPIVITPIAAAPVAPAPVVVAPATIAPIIIAPTVVTQAVAPVVITPATVAPVVVAPVATAPKVAVPVVPVAVTPIPAKTLPAKPPVAPKPSAPVKATTIAKPSSDIVTLFGAVYHHAQVDKVDTDGVVISYWTEAGGYSIIKLDFNQFTPEFVDQYRQ